MLIACQNMNSLVRKYNALISYITRESISSSIGGRGISHILGTENIEDIYIPGEPTTMQGLVLGEILPRTFSGGVLGSHVRLYLKML